VEPRVNIFIIVEVVHDSLGRVLINSIHEHPNGSESESFLAVELDFRVGKVW